MYTERINTFKSGPFTISRKYSLRETEPLVVESRILNETVKDLPILPSISAQIDQDVIKRSIFGTAAIEGNPLSEEKVAELIEQNDYESLKNNAEIEIQNLKKAYSVVKGFDRKNEPIDITEALIKKIHELITINTIDEQNNPGQYRNHKVQVGDKSHGGIYTPPKCLQDIKNLMQVFVTWLNSPELKKLYPPVRAALAHYHLGLIHPFGNGNGRTARLIEAIIIQTSGFKYSPILLSNFYYQNIDEYFLAFSKTEHSKESDVTFFVVFVLKALIKALNDLKSRIIYYIRLFTIRDYLMFLKKDKDLTQRQFDFLNILLEHNRPFDLHELYTASDFKLLYREVSERTARRDLKKLLSKHLLVLNSEKKYTLNLGVLEQGLK